jgi:hypothetical protein
MASITTASRPRTVRSVTSLLQPKIAGSADDQRAAARIVQELLQLRGDCVVNGNIYAGKLQVEPSATFNGQCHMGANVVDMSEKEVAVFAK